MMSASILRRAGFPLAVAVVAMAVWWWSAQQTVKQIAEVRTSISELWVDMAARRDVTGRINPADPTSERLILEQLDRVVSSDSSGVVPETRVIRGDTLHQGTQGQPATHTVMLTRRGSELIGLRVHHGGSSDSIRILGCWLPQSHASNTSPPTPNP